MAALGLALACPGDSRAGLFRKRASSRHGCTRAVALTAARPAGGVDAWAPPPPTDVPHARLARPEPGGDFVAWLNGVRAAHGLAPVAYDPGLAGWAARNSEQQAVRGMGHHVMGTARRQNAGVGSLATVGPMWMASPAHRAALLDPTVRWVGVAGNGPYWTFNGS